MSEGYTPGTRFAVMDSPYLLKQKLRISETVQQVVEPLQNQTAQKQPEEQKAKKGARSRIGPVPKKKPAAGSAGDAASDELQELNDATAGKFGLPQVLTEHLASVPYRPSNAALLKSTAPAIHRLVDAHLHAEELSFRAGSVFARVGRSRVTSCHDYSQVYVQVGDTHHEPRTVTRYPISGSGSALVSPANATMVETSHGRTETGSRRLAPNDLRIIRERKKWVGGWGLVRTTTRGTVRKARPLILKALKTISVALNEGSRFALDKIDAAANTVDRF